MNYVNSLDDVDSGDVECDTMKSHDVTPIIQDTTINTPAMPVDTPATLDVPLVSTQKPTLLYDYSSWGLSWAYGKTRGIVQPYISTQFNANPIDDYGRLWLGDVATASNIPKLQEIGITHVVSAILGIGELSSDFVYCRIPVRDVVWEDLSMYFDSTADFIENALNSSENNKVYVHCIRGISRSATLIASWLIKYRKLSTDDAIALLKSKRDVVDPNPGFIEQLRLFENKQ